MWEKESEEWEIEGKMGIARTLASKTSKTKLH